MIGDKGIRRQRDHALVRAVQLEARLEEAVAERDRLRQELATVQRALERVVDNALFAAGASPVFEPEAARFQPRDTEAQRAEAERLAARPPLSPEQWRRRVEELDREAAQRDRKAQVVEELRRLRDERARAAETA